jgi:hypothetical protein
MLKAIPGIDGGSVRDDIRESGAAEQEKSEARTLLLHAKIGPSRCSCELHIGHEAPKGREVILNLPRFDKTPELRCPLLLPLALESQGAQVAQR